jgi:hypothetical protein
MRNVSLNDTAFGMEEDTNEPSLLCKKCLKAAEGNFSLMHKKDVGRPNKDDQGGADA